MRSPAHSSRADAGRQPARRPKRRLLALDHRLCEHVQNRLHAKDSPEQISRRLALVFPDELMGDVPLTTALQRWRPDLPLFVLAAGPRPPNPTVLLASNAMREIVMALESPETTLLIDSPPLLPVTDPAVLAQIADGVVLVSRVDSTRTDQLASAVDNLRTVGATILGVVVNRVKEEKEQPTPSTITPPHRAVTVPGEIGRRGQPAALTTHAFVSPHVKRWRTSQRPWFLGADTKCAGRFRSVSSSSVVHTKRS